MEGAHYQVNYFVAPKDPSLCPMDEFSNAEEVKEKEVEQRRTVLVNSTISVHSYGRERTSQQIW